MCVVEAFAALIAACRAEFEIEFEGRRSEEQQSKQEAEGGRRSDVIQGGKACARGFEFVKFEFARFFVSCRACLFM